MNKWFKISCDRKPIKFKMIKISEKPIIAGIKYRGELNQNI